MIRVADPRKLAQALAQVRDMLALSRHEVARMIAAATGRSELGINSQLWEWENGRRSPNAVSLAPYLDALDLDLALVPRLDPDRPPPVDLPLSVAASLTAGHLHMLYQQESCCQHCCAPCAALAALLATGQIDMLYGAYVGPDEDSDIWDADKRQVRRDWLLGCWSADLGCGPHEASAISDRFGSWN